MDMRCYTATLKTEPEEKTERPWVNSIMAKLLESEIQKELDAFKEYAENHSEDKINSPAHYQLDGLDIESIDIIRSVLGKKGFEKFCRGNAIKYIIRADHKGGAEDLEKAVKYLEWEIYGLDDFEEEEDYDDFEEDAEDYNDYDEYAEIYENWEQKETEAETEAETEESERTENSGKGKVVKIKR